MQMNCVGRLYISITLCQLSLEPKIMHNLERTIYAGSMPKYNL